MDSTLNGKEEHKVATGAPSSLEVHDQVKRFGGDL